MSQVEHPPAQALPQWLLDMHDREAREVVQDHLRAVVSTQAARSTRVHAALAAAATNPQARLRLEAVAAIVGLSKSSIYERIKRGEFPAPIREGTRCSRWLAGSISAWLEAR